MMRHRDSPGHMAPPPDLISEQCIHTRLVQASCQACLAACPNQAWVLNVRQLALDPTRCDGCGLCAPACPQRALVQKLKPLVLTLGNHKIAFARCAPSGGEGLGLLPCLHGLGLGELAELYQAGVRSLVVAHPGCDLCPRGGGVRLGDRVGDLNQLLASRGLAPLDHRRLDLAAWQAMRDQSQTLSQGPLRSRREFLRGAFHAAVRLQAPATPPEPLPPGRLLPRVSGSDLFPWAPRLDPDHCTACGACARLCPQGALALESGPDGQAGYRVSAAHCSGCRICTDVCDRQAVTLQPLAVAGTDWLPLGQFRCRDCGTSFLFPQSQQPDPDRCPICANRGQRPWLFQVYA